jgi:hypothetical protein
MRLAKIDGPPPLCKPDMVYTLNRAHGLHIIGYLHAIDQWG